MKNVQILPIPSGRFLPPWPGDLLLTADQIEHGTKVRRDLQLQPNASTDELAEARLKELINADHETASR